MVHINNLTNEQAVAAARQMLERGRHALANQIMAQVDARLKVISSKRKVPRKRVAKTGELA